MLALDVVETLDFDAVVVVVVVVVDWSWIELMEVVACKLDANYQLIFSSSFIGKNLKRHFLKR